LQLFPQSGRHIDPYQKNGVRQELELYGIPHGKGSSVRLRYKVSYRLGQELKEEQGLVPPLGVL
jgi:hypothetical protein